MLIHINAAETIGNLYRIATAAKDSTPEITIKIAGNESCGHPWPCNTPGKATIEKVNKPQTIAQIPPIKPEVAVLGTRSLPANLKAAGIRSRAPGRTNMSQTPAPMRDAAVITAMADQTSADAKRGLPGHRIIDVIDTIPARIIDKRIEVIIRNEGDVVKPGDESSQTRKINPANVAQIPPANPNLNVAGMDCLTSVIVKSLISI